jgi:probable F420-dependent oxidoreductase
MEFGFNIPARGPLAEPATIAEMARRGEALGFTWLAIPDHIVIPKDIGSRYPYSGTGAFPGQASGDCLEQLTLLAWVAALTERARLLTSVMVVPHRNPVHAAKTIATADVLSGGRVTLGIGAGWMAEEFEAIGTEPFAERGAVTDEYIEIFKVLWTEEDPRFEGRYARFSDISFLPRPVQRPHPPIWVGGESGPALRRTARYGDAWYPIGANPRHPYNTVERMQAGIEKLHQAAEREGRDPASIQVVYWGNWYDEAKGPVMLDDGSRHLLTGEPGQIAEDVRALAALGVDHVLFNFQRASLAASLESMQRFTEEVAPHAR